MDDESPSPLPLRRESSSDRAAAAPPIWGGGGGAGRPRAGRTAVPTRRAGSWRLPPAASYMAHILSLERFGSNRTLQELAAAGRGWVPLARIATFPLPNERGWDVHTLADGARAAGFTVSTDGAFVAAPQPTNAATADTGGVPKGLSIESYLKYTFDATSWETNERLKGMAAANRGFVPLALVAKFPYPRSSGWSVNHLATAARRCPEVELNPAGNAVRPAQAQRSSHRSKRTPATYIEHLFDSRRFSEDGSMQRLAEQNRGWVSLAEVAKFSLAKRMGWGLSELLEAAAECSHVVELRGSAVRPRLVPLARGAGRRRSRTGSTGRPPFSTGASSGIYTAESLTSGDVGTVGGSGGGAGDGGAAVGGSAAGGAGGEAGGEAGLHSTAAPPVDKGSAGADTAELTVLPSGLSKADIQGMWDSRPVLVAPSVDLSKDFGVLSWNSLADYMAKKDKTAYKQPGGGWKHRSSLIVDRILFRAPDIVCLQEVQKEAHADELLRSIAPHGYVGVFNDSVPGRNTVVLAWNTNTFELVPGCVWHGLQLLPEVNKAEGPGDADLNDATYHIYRAAHRLALQHKHRALAKQRVVFALLRHLRKGNLVLACSLHTNVPLLAPHATSREQLDASWLPLAEIEWCLAEIALHRQAAVDHGLADSPDEVEIVIGVDANSKPDSAAALYLTQGGVPDGHLVEEDAAQFDTSVRGASIGWAGISHPLPLRSAFRSVAEREPDYTTINHKTAFIAPIDYIATSAVPLVVLDVYPWPRSALLPFASPSAKHPRGWPTPILPNAVIPSDHLPMEACIAFAGTTADSSGSFPLVPSLTSDSGPSMDASPPGL